MTKEHKCFQFISGVNKSKHILLRYDTSVFTTELRSLFQPYCPNNRVDNRTMNLALSDVDERQFSRVFLESPRKVHRLYLIY